MKKIPSLFARNYDGDRMIRDEVVPDCEWVLVGEGVTTLKYDGTACLVQEGKLYKRYDAKAGKVPPDGWFPCEEAPCDHTEHWPGWVLVSDGPEDRWHREALWNDKGEPFADGTYELLGPKVQGNPYGYVEHFLMPHGQVVLRDVPRTFEGLKEYFGKHEIEGIVWHHPDGRMAKIKRRDFGYPWPVKKAVE